MRTRLCDRTLLLTLVVAALFVRVAGIHLHLCYDGQEAPATLHMVDAGLHDDHDTSSHQDLDVQLDDVLTKSAKSGFNLPAIAGTHVLPFALPGVLHRIAVFTGDTPPHSTTGFLRPPLRAPPR
jgi:hypothetical protein